MNAMLNWLHQGPDQAIVDDVQVISQKTLYESKRNIYHIV